MTYDVIPDLQLSFAVNDLGFISWGKKYLERGQMTKSQSFTGVEIIDGEVHDPEFDFGELEFDRVQASKGKTEMLRTSSIWGPSTRFGVTRSAWVCFTTYVSGM